MSLSTHRLPRLLIETEDMSDIPITQPTLLLKIRDAEDEVSWERFVKIYTPLVFGYCRKRGLQDADASDVAQEVMRTVSQAINRFDYNKKKGTFRGWLLMVTRNKLLKHFSKLQKQPIGSGRTTIQAKLEETPDAAETDHWNTAYQQRLFQWASTEVKDEFSEKTWSAFWLAAVENQKSQEIATDLEMSLGAVYIAKSRVIARIRKQIETINGSEDSVLWSRSNQTGDSLQ